MPHGTLKYSHSSNSPLHKCRYVAAVELLGERDEALEELRADLMDVKSLLRDVTLASTSVANVATQ
jgi:hypothetical protein